MHRALASTPLHTRHNVFHEEAFLLFILSCFCRGGSGQITFNRSLSFTEQCDWWHGNRGIDGKSRQHPFKCNLAGSLHRHMWLQRWGGGGLEHLQNSGARCCFLLLFCGCLCCPESISLTQFESARGTAERDNDVWQPVVSLLHAFACLGGNSASLC